MKKADIIPQKSYKERYDMIRNPKRIRSSDVIEGVFENLSYYESPDPSLIAARGTVDGIKCIVLGQEKPRKGKESKATGMITADGYGFTLDMLDLAEQKGLPVVSFIDTYGGDSRMDSELGGQSFLISDCISRFCGVRTPTTSFVIGEGGSGGALALQVADVAFMLENALYSVIAPESCCRIIFHKRLAAGEKIEDTLPDALDVLRPGAPHLKEIGMIDEILPEPAKGAHTLYPETIETIKDALVDTLKPWVTTYKSGKQIIRKKTLEKILKERRRKVLNYGEFVESLDELAKRKIKRKKPDHIKTIDVEREDFHMMFLLKAHLEAEGIDETEIYECEKEWDPDRNLFKVAGGCGFIPLQKYLDNYYACPKCGKGEYLSVEDQIEKLCDRDTFHEIESDLTIEKLVGSERYNFGKYKATLEKLNGKTFSKEGLITGTAQINGKQVVLVISDLKFFGGSFGAVFGEKFKRAIDFAVKYRHPFISVCDCSHTDYRSVKNRTSLFATVS